MLIERELSHNAVLAPASRHWDTQPTIGVDQDNIYQSGGTVHYQGTEQPTCATDTFLVN